MSTTMNHQRRRSDAERARREAVEAECWAILAPSLGTLLWVAFFAWLAS